MRRLALAVALLAALTLSSARADGDTATMIPDEGRLGEQIPVRLDVYTAPGASVEIDPAAQSWGAFQVVRIDSQEQRPEGDQVHHIITVIVAPFTTGDAEFAAAINVISGTDIEPRTLPALRLTIIPTLAPDAPLELSPLPPPEPIGGAQSPFLWPAIALGAVCGVALIGAITFLVSRAVLRRPRRVTEPDEEPRPYPDLSGAGALLDSDPVAAYRALAFAVRRHLAEQYGFPARALTASELERRMEAEGLDRWQARLVAGLLENCDAVVYAGYRPAPERRRHDLTMAREIVEAPA